MSSNELNNLVRTGALKVEPADQKEFDGLFNSGRTRLADAKKGNLALESQFDLAYNAAHALSLAAMRWHDYRPDNLVHRFSVSGPHARSWAGRLACFGQGPPN